MDVVFPTIISGIGAGLYTFIRVRRASVAHLLDF